MACKLPPLESYLQEHFAGNLYMTEMGKYAKFKYTEEVVYAGTWNEVTVNARGHVFDRETGECVLRPWSKFYNYSELVGPDGKPTKFMGKYLKIPGVKVPDFGMGFRCMDKLDGSLCVAGFVPGYGLMATSSGAFTSWQALWAKNWLSTHLDNRAMLPGRTYLYEIIANEDLHPIRYDYEACVLTGIIDNATGEELPYEQIKGFADMYGLRCAEVVECGTFDDAIKYARALPADKEGLVITFDNGFKVKAKGEDFLVLQKLFHSLSPSYMMEKMLPETLDFDHDFMVNVPEEFTELREFSDEARKVAEAGFARAVGMALIQHGRHIPRADVFKKNTEALRGEAWVGHVLPNISMLAYGILEKEKPLNWENLKEARELLVSYMKRTVNDYTKKRDNSHGKRN